VPSLKERLTSRVEEIRERSSLVDHAVRTVAHYNELKGNLQAGAVTYFAMLSVFPILALAFFAVGWVAKVYPGAEEDLVTAIDSVLPGLIGGGDGQLSLETIKSSYAAVGLLGLLGVLYAGLGWISGMREALVVMFQTPARRQHGFVGGKLLDLLSLVLVGLVLLVTVTVSGFVSTYSTELLEWLGLGTGLSPLVKGLTVLIGIGASMVLMWALFRLLAEPGLPPVALWWGALIGALGFEVLKRLSSLLLAATKASPAVQAFGIALVLLVWINYTSRVILYAAAWARTHPAARAVRDREAELAHTVEGPSVQLLPEQPEPAPAGAGGTRVAFAAGGASMLALMALVRRVVNRKD
jgi:membrane protein